MAKIWDKNSMHVIATFPTLRGAKAALTRKYAAQAEKDGREYVAGEDAEHAALDTEVEVKSMMNGAPVQILKSQVGTCCDPSTERYWSM